MENINADIIESIKNDILGALEKVIDPELGIDIVNLGLIYGIELEKNGKCIINLTLTTIGCPLADTIIASIESELKKLSHVKTVVVNLVWTPAWTPARMTRYARIALGIR